jgi:ribosomal protein S21
MKINVKRFNNDVGKAYKVMMRKLNNEGFYTDLKKREYFTSKGEQQRLDKKVGRKRFLKAEKKRQELFEKLERRIPNSKRPNNNRPKTKSKN